MFCPQCNQQQFSDGTRFCQRCGFQLVGVSPAFHNNGAPFVPATYPKERLPLIKRQELRSGAKIIFLSIFLVIPSFMLAIIIDHALPLGIPVIMFLVGLAQIFYYFLFGETILPLKKQKQSYEFNEYERRADFQPMHRLPFSVVDLKPLNTAEFPQNIGAARGTTNLFNGE